MFSKYIEQYEVGETWTSKGRTITETDLVMFAAFSGDWYPLHTDATFAAKTPFGQRIAHGLLVLSAASGLLTFEPGVVVAFYGMESVRFTNPTYIGDTIHVELEVTAIEPKEAGRGVITARQQIKKQSGETVASATIKLMVNSAP